MGRMTGKTVGDLLPGKMRLMALQATGNLLVNRMTESAGLGGMTAGNLGKIMALFLMTGKTFPFCVAGKLQGSHGHMRHDMALTAVCQGKMGRARMALGTGRNDNGSFWGMHGLVAVNTGDLTPVTSALHIYRLDLIGVAFRAVRQLKRSPCFRHYRQSAGENKQKD